MVHVIGFGDPRVLRGDGHRLRVIQRGLGVPERARPARGAPLPGAPTRSERRVAHLSRWVYLAICLVGGILTQLLYVEHGSPASVRLMTLACFLFGLARDLHRAAVVRADCPPPAGRASTAGAGGWRSRASESPRETGAAPLASVVTGARLEHQHSGRHNVPESARPAPPVAVFSPRHGGHPAMSEPLQASGPELSRGIELSDIPDGGMLTAQVNGEPVVAVRRGEEVFVLAATCGHYGAPLWDGVFLGNELRCPWHHARFDVRTGEAVNPPSPRGLATWLVVREGLRVRTGARREPTAARTAVRNAPSSVLIVGAGACRRRLRGAAPPPGLRRARSPWWRRMARAGRSTAPTCPRTILAGSAPDEWLPIRGGEFYAGQRIELRRRRGHPARPGSEGGAPGRWTVDPVRGRSARHRRRARSGSPFRARTCRTCTRCARSPTAAPSSPRAARPKRAVVIGASFIGLEVAASLRAREASRSRSSRRRAGPSSGCSARSSATSSSACTRRRACMFHLGRKPASIDRDGGDARRRHDGRGGAGGDGRRRAAANRRLAEKRRPRRSIAACVVDANLRTSARRRLGRRRHRPLPDRGGETCAHRALGGRRAAWARSAARNMLGVGAPYGDVPFFWSQHYDVPINYVGHAEAWDAVQVAGSLAGPRRARRLPARRAASWRWRASTATGTASSPRMRSAGTTSRRSSSCYARSSEEMDAFRRRGGRAGRRWRGAGRQRNVLLDFMGRYSFRDRAPTNPAVLMTLERTACFGTCPIYRVVVFKDGRIEYPGEQYVKVVGQAQRRLGRRS